MEKIVDKLKNIDREKAIRMVSMVCLMTFVFASMTGIVAHAEPQWGKNAYDWGKDLAWWAALAVIGFFSVKFIAKRMWVQFGGFILLGAIVLVIIDDPTRLKTIGLQIWNTIFK